MPGFAGRALCPGCHQGTGPYGNDPSRKKGHALRHNDDGNAVINDDVHSITVGDGDDAIAQHVR